MLKICFVSSLQFQMMGTPLEQITMKIIWTPLDLYKIQKRVIFDLKQGREILCLS